MGKPSKHVSVTQTRKSFPAKYAAKTTAYCAFDPDNDISNHICPLAPQFVSTSGVTPKKQVPEGKHPTIVGETVCALPAFTAEHIVKIAKNTSSLMKYFIYYSSCILYPHVQ